MGEVSPLHVPQADVRAWRSMLEVHARVVEQLAVAFKAEHVLTVSEFDVLINIHPDEPIRHGDLACRVVLSRSALTRLVDRLVQRGYVTRRPVEQDNRGVLIALTDAGRVVRATAARTNDAIVQAAFAPLDPADVTQMLCLMQKLDAPSAQPGEPS